MAITSRAFVSWGVRGAVSADQRANLFGSWGMLSSAPAPPTIVTRIESYFLNLWAIWKNRFGGPSTGRTLN